jgi:peptidoglycan/xylan/chitin deacetylase (PgdA/CDA1 family)
MVIARRAKRALRTLIGQASPLLFATRPRHSLAVLTYHRVLPRGDTAWQSEQPGMCVTPETLALHIAVLRDHFEIVDLQDWLERARSNRPLPDRACCLTFDDGWRDNHDHAFPVLQRAAAPATIFLVAGLIGSRYQFWPNRLALLLRTVGAAQPSFASAELATVGIDSSATGSFEERLDAAVSFCKRKPDAAVIEQLDLLEGRLPAAARTTTRDLVNEDEILAMQRSGLVRFGSHSINHTRLVDGLDEALLSSEVRRSRGMLESLLGRPVPLFCYPNGEYSARALQAVRATYDAAVTTRRGWNRRDSDPWQLARLPLHEDISADRASFLARLTGYV